MHSFPFDGIHHNFPTGSLNRGDSKLCGRFWGNPAKSPGKGATATKISSKRHKKIPRKGGVIPVGYPEGVN